MAVGIDTSQVVLVLAQILVVRKAETVLRLVGCVAAVQIEACLLYTSDAADD